ncbi:MAG: hypothetical protein H0V81_10765 [Solirubrobacterales bacterium]|nr:hypothetical protein [Solirubrobacterales bacterium]
MVESTPALPAAASPLPELAGVHWRPLVDERSLRRLNRGWTVTTIAHVVPFAAGGAVLLAAEPLAFPVTLVSFAHAWIIPELYAARGANVVKPRRFRASERSEAVSVGLLGDLVGHDARELHRESGLVLERGSLGAWLVGPTGALLVRPGGRRVLCYCVRVPDPELPAGDRIAHLLLALRSDEIGFTTVANCAFSGARWRVRRRLPAVMRPALDRARGAARELA